jgi:hypothetical protein
MNTCKKSVQKQPFTHLSLAGLGLCALCCALPVLGAVMSVGSLSVLAFYLEKVGIGLILLGVLLSFVFYLRNRKKAVECGPMCNCQPSTS